MEEEGNGKLHRGGGDTKRCKQYDRRWTLSSQALIVGMLLLAATVSLAAVWYLRGLSQRSLAFWGAETGQLILHAPRVELTRFTPETALGAAESRDISQAPGLTNLRRALMQDASFDWKQGPIPSPAEWDYALHFRDDGRQATLTFSLAPHHHAALQGSATSIDPRPIATGLQRFFDEQFSK